MPPPRGRPGSGPSSPQTLCESKFHVTPKTRQKLPREKQHLRERRRRLYACDPGACAPSKAARSSSAERSLETSPAGGRGAGGPGRADWPGGPAAPVPAPPGGPRGPALSQPHTPARSARPRRPVPGVSPLRRAVAAAPQVLGKGILSEYLRATLSAA